jgi:hypothetical protein
VRQHHALGRGLGPVETQSRCRARIRSITHPQEIAARAVSS